MVLSHPAVQVDARHLPHHQVAEDDVEGLVLAEKLQGLLAALRRLHVVVGEGAADGDQDVGLVVDHQDPALGGDLVPGVVFGGVVGPLLVAPGEHLQATDELTDPTCTLGGLVGEPQEPLATGRRDLEALDFLHQEVEVRDDVGHRVVHLVGHPADGRGFRGRSRHCACVFAWLLRVVPAHGPLRASSSGAR